MAARGVGGHAVRRASRPWGKSKGWPALRQPWKRGVS